jgi:soluble lytic murein transglycosylase-like protein
MRVFQILGIVLVLAGLSSLQPQSQAAADSINSTPVIVSPQTTAVPPSPQATAPPVTVAPEQSTPQITSLVPPTAPAAQNSKTATSEGQPQSQPAATPIPQHAPGAPIVAPLPSPAELKLNARLRWGRHIPAAVRRWAFLVVPAAKKYNLDSNLIAAVMTMESGGDPLAWNSGSDARGLMQILHGPWDPKANIFTGARMLSQFLAEFQTLKLALAAYNAGPNAVLSFNGVPPYRETRDYVIVVSYLYDLFSHRKLNTHRKTLYRSTLKDLENFSDQRKKVGRLAQVAHVSPATDLLCSAFITLCGQSSSQIFSTLDPFWPVKGAPDPLQKVDPYSP